VNVEASYSLPVSGAYVPELECFDEAILDFMEARGIQAGTIAVMKGRILMLSRGYGWQDIGHTQVVSPDALMRIASIDKPITSAVVKKLIREGQLSADTRVFSYLDVSPPPGQTADPRLADITVQHLLDHEGGWDNDESGYDPCFRVVEIAAALEIPSPAGTLDIAEYMAGQPLQFTPGTRSAYCNLGYDLLRVIAERASGVSFVTYLQNEFHLDINRSYAFPEDRNPREIWYLDPNVCQNVYAPSTIVPCPDGGFAVSSRTVIPSSSALVSFLDQYWISGEPRYPDQYTGYVYWFYGSLPGTFSFTYQTGDGVNIAVLFNQRTDPSGLDYGLIKEAIDGALAEVQQWPVFFRVGSDGDLYTTGKFTARSFASGGADLAEWVNVGEDVSPGDVVVSHADTPLAALLSREPCSHSVLGVVSTEPGIVLGASEDNGPRALLALTGIVPVKVADEGGPIRPGDLLVTSSTPGHAMRWAGSDPCPCALVGKALEPMTDETGVILILLTAH